MAGMTKGKFGFLQGGGEHEPGPAVGYVQIYVKSSALSRDPDLAISVHLMTEAATGLVAPRCCEAELVVLAFIRAPAGTTGSTSTLRDATGTGAHATDAAVRSGGWRTRRRASVLRFCTMAARWNSSRAPERPRSRSRSKP
jgi:hypothetical protein